MNLLTKNNIFILIGILLVVYIVIIPGRYDTKIRLPKHLTGKNIIYFGDSITEGYGSTEGNDYPSVIERRYRISGINAGVSGNNSRDAYLRLEKDVLSNDPKIVVVEFGANDFFVKIPKDETLANIEKILKEITDTGAHVVLVHIDMGVFDQYKKEYSRLAKKYNVSFVADIMKGVFGNRNMMSDGIHPNDAGYELIGNRIGDVLEKILSARASS